MNEAEAVALFSRVDAIAADVGRLRRRFASNPDAWTGGYIADRIAGNLQTLDAMMRPTAAELVAWTFPGDEEAVEAALEVVDKRDEDLRRLLGDAAAEPPASATPRRRPVMKIFQRRESKRLTDRARRPW